MADNISVTQQVTRISVASPGPQGATGPAVSDGDKGDITISGGGTVYTIDAGTVTVAKISATGTPDSTTFLSGAGTWATPAGGGGGGSGTVTSVSVVTSAGISGTVATATTTPAITLALGAITPTTVNGVTLSGTGTLATGTYTLTVAGTASVSGTNTGDNSANTLYSGLVSNATHTGDATGATALTLATVNSNVGSFGSATAAVVFTVNGKGLVTAASSATITPAVGSITGLGTGNAAWLATNAGGAVSLVTSADATNTITPASGIYGITIKTVDSVDPAFRLTNIANATTDTWGLESGMVVSSGVQSVVFTLLNGGRSYTLNPPGTGTDNTSLTLPIAAISASGSVLSFTTGGVSTWVQLYDASGNVLAPNVVEGYTTTTSSIGTLSLSVSSNRQQFVTGSNTHAVTLPSVATVSLGHAFRIVNNSTRPITVATYSGTYAVTTLPPGDDRTITCIGASGTSAADWDSSVPMYPKYTTTATATGTTTLTAASTQQQFFTGTLNQTVTLPDSQYMVLGQAFRFVNKSTGAITINASSGADLVTTIYAGGECWITCILTSGTTAASWSVQRVGSEIVSFTGSGTYSVPAGLKSAMVRGSGSGGGGGGGCCKTALASGSTFGGQGGNGASYASALFTLAELGGVGAAITVTIGAGGTSGAGRLTAGNATSGGAGGTTSFGSLMSITGGAAGQAGANFNKSAVAITAFTERTGGVMTTLDATTGAVAALGSGAGGTGAALVSITDATATGNSGGRGADGMTGGTNAVGGGGAGGTAGNAGTTPSAISGVLSGHGGGGGGSLGSTTVVAGAGGGGGTPGGGGGGGGAGVAGTGGSGAGGVGGRGEIQVTNFF